MGNLLVVPHREHRQVGIDGAVVDDVVLQPSCIDESASMRRSVEHQVASTLCLSWQGRVCVCLLTCKNGNAPMRQCANAPCSFRSFSEMSMKQAKFIVRYPALSSSFGQACPFEHFQLSRRPQRNRDQLPSGHRMHILGVSPEVELGVEGFVARLGSLDRT